MNLRRIGKIIAYLYSINKRLVDEWNPQINKNSILVNTDYVHAFDNKTSQY